MSATDDGGPAFPGDNASSGPFYGMTLRDYFAAQAMVAVCDRLTTPGNVAEIVAQDAYRIADAMLAERAQARA